MFGGLNTVTNALDTDKLKQEGLSKNNNPDMLAMIRELQAKVSELENERAELDAAIGLIDRKDDLAKTQEVLNSLIQAFNKVLNLKSV